MKHPLRHREALLRGELDGAAFEVNDELTLDDVEELIFGVVFVPMKLTLQHTKANDAVVHLT